MGGCVWKKFTTPTGNLAELTAWHDNGRKAKQGNFNGVWRDVWGGPQLHGRRDGTWTYWDTNGDVICEGQWKRGKPWEGTCIVPTQSGSLWVGEKATYREGQLVGPIARQMDF